MSLVKINEKKKGSQKSVKSPPKRLPTKTLGPVSDLERHLPNEWWSTLFNSLYLKTDGDVVENQINTVSEVDLLISAANISRNDHLLDVCCGQGRHALELARRGFTSVQGIDRSRYLVRLARKRAREANLEIHFSEGDARKLRVPSNSKDCIFLMGNSFGYFERQEDDLLVLKAVMNALKSGGRLILDIVDGEWMAKHFEPRSWEWVDQNYFVNRERSLSSDRKRIVTRELVTHSEIGVVADQFYAERLYAFEEIAAILESLGFLDVRNIANLQSDSTRGHDLGMMAHRLFISCVAPKKREFKATPLIKKNVTVILGDPLLPDKVKKDGKFNQEDLATIERLKKTLAELKDYTISYLDDHSNLIKKLLSHPPSFVFNLCDEGLKNEALLELHLPAFLEILGIPYTGAAPGCLALCYDKSKVCAIAASMEIPVPLETYFNPSDQAANIPAFFPALIKPACGDSSIGITQKSLVHNAEELLEYLDYLRAYLPAVPILVQEFLSGTEYSVALIGNANDLEVLPILEVDYSDLPEELPKILSYESKWDPSSPQWQKIRYQEARIDEGVRTQLINYSRQLFERIDCRDYARFDFRCDEKGVVKLLEVNPNPGWCWDGKLNMMAAFAGWSYAGLLDKILKAAFTRYGLNERDGEGG